MKKIFKSVAIAGLLAFSSLAIAQQATVNSVNNLFNKAQTYRASVVGFAVAPNSGGMGPTDIFNIAGSTTRTIYIKSITVSGSKASGGIGSTLYLVKKTVANAGGSLTNMARVALDSTNSVSAAMPKYYTSNATTIGTGVTLSSRVLTWLTTNAQAAVTPDGITWNFGQFIDQYAVLRGVAQSLSIGFGNTITVGTGLANVEIEWMEQ